jgi:hypothetical protein
VQVTGLLPVHVPFWHWSVVVQPLLSLQVVPFAALGLVQAPVLGLQVPATWQASSAVQVTGVPVLHVPARQVSPVVHLSPSSQALPSFLVGLLQVPVAVSQVPGT